MLRALQVVFSMITLILAGYGLFTKDFQLGAYIILFLGLTMLLLGIQEFKKNRKMVGWLLIGIFVFSMFICIQRIVYY